MNQNRKYFIPILIALFCLMYQAIPLHKIFSDNNFISFSIVEDDDATEKENSSTKKTKANIDDFINLQSQSIFANIGITTTIFYFQHLPKSYQVNAVFAPPPELV